MALALVTAEPEPWEQQPNETEYEHALFWLWLRSPGQLGELSRTAAEHRWSERAAEFRAQLEPAPGRSLDAIKRDVLDIVSCQLRKVARLAKRELLPARDIALWVQIARDIEVVEINQLAGGRNDLSALTDEEFRCLERLTEKIA